MRSASTIKNKVLEGMLLFVLWRFFIMSIPALFQPFVRSDTDDCLANMRAHTTKENVVDSGCWKVDC